ncbi:MAG: hypothetical protein ACKVOH_02025 [Chlamydiales bacterium]
MGDAAQPVIRNADLPWMHTQADGERARAVTRNCQAVALVVIAFMAAAGGGTLLYFGNVVAFENQVMCAAGIGLCIASAALVAWAGVRKCQSRTLIKAATEHDAVVVTVGDAVAALTGDYGRLADVEETKRRLLIAHIATTIPDVERIEDQRMLGLLREIATHPEWIEAVEGDLPSPFAKAICRVMPRDTMTQAAFVKLVTGLGELTEGHVTDMLISFPRQMAQYMRDNLPCRQYMWPYYFASLLPGNKAAFLAGLGDAVTTEGFEFSAAQQAELVAAGIAVQHLARFPQQMAAIIHGRAVDAVAVDEAALFAAMTPEQKTEFVSALLRAGREVAQLSPEELGVYAASREPDIALLAQRYADLSAGELPPERRAAIILAVVTADHGVARLSPADLQLYAGMREADPQYLLGRVEELRVEARPLGLRLALAQRADGDVTGEELNGIFTAHDTSQAQVETILAAEARFATYVAHLDTSRIVPEEKILDAFVARGRAVPTREVPLQKALALKGMARSAEELPHILAACSAEEKATVIRLASPDSLRAYAVTLGELPDDSILGALRLRKQEIPAAEISPVLRKAFHGADYLLTQGELYSVFVISSADECAALMADYNFAEVVAHAQVQNPVCQNLAEAVARRYSDIEFPARMTPFLQRVADCAARSLTAQLPADGRERAEALYRSIAGELCPPVVDVLAGEIRDWSAFMSIVDVRGRPRSIARVLNSHPKQMGEVYRDERYKAQDVRDFADLLDDAAKRQFVHALIAGGPRVLSLEKGNWLPGKKREKQDAVALIVMEIASEAEALKNNQAEFLAAFECLPPDSLAAAAKALSTKLIQATPDPAARKAIYEQMLIPYNGKRPQTPMLFVRAFLIDGLKVAGHPFFDS